MNNISISPSELINLSNRVSGIRSDLKNKLDRNTKIMPVNEVNIEGSLVVGTMGDIMELLKVVTPTHHGVMSKEDKIKLDGIDVGANAYEHPPTHSADMIVDNSMKRFVTDALIEKWNTHVHDDIYYRKNEVDSLLTTKSDVGHTHDDRYYTEQEITGLLNTKANVEHGVHVPTPLNDPQNIMRFLHSSNAWVEITAAKLNTLTKEEIDSKFLQFSKNMDWKESVNTRADIETTYPNPEDGWTVNVKDDNYTYRYNGSEWVVIGGNAYVHPPTHPANMITTDASRRFVTDSQIANWDSKANGNHGYHIPTPETAVGNKFLRNDNSWQPITPSVIGTYTSGEIDNKLAGKANSSHGTHITPNSGLGATYFLRCDNTWQAITPPLIGAYTKDETNHLLNGKANTSHGNHVPAPEGANNARFLRNDNTWQNITPGNIGAYTKGETDGRIGGWNILQAASAPGSANFNTLWDNNRIYRLDTTQTGLGTSPDYGTVLVMRGGADTGTQLQFPYNTNEIYFRNSNFTPGAANVTRGWSRIWSTNNFDPNGKANTAHDHPNLSRFRGVAGWGASGYQVAASFEASGHVGIELRTTNANTFGFGGHQDGNLRWWYGAQTGDTSAGKNYIMTLNANGDLRPNRLFNAVWNDYAEYFPKPKGYETEPGDIIALDIESDKEVYVKADSLNSTVIIGVHSDSYGHVLGGDEPPEGYTGTMDEFNKDRYIPVGLAGRVKAKCIGIINKGDKLVISDIPGVARSFDRNIDDPSDVFGIAVESKENPDEISRVKMFIK